MPTEPPLNTCKILKGPDFLEIRKKSLQYGKKKLLLTRMLIPGLGPAWFAIHFDSLLSWNRINQWFANEWITIHLRLIFDSISFWFGLFHILSQYKVNAYFFLVNQIESIWKIKVNLKSFCDSLWRIKNSRIKINRFGSSSANDS